ncbi:MAG: hypothetical protein AB1898_08550 [Acidobacteriota bacterium]
MSLVTSVPGSRPAWNPDYEPIAQATCEIQRTRAERENYLHGSASDWLPVFESALHGIKAECTRANWDGPDSIPVSEEAIRLTAQIGHALYNMMPTGTPVPDLIPEPDGEICISWSVSSYRSFSLSVGARRKINFAAQFGKEGAVHAWQPIDTSSTGSLRESLQDVVRYVGRIFARPAEGS